MDGHAAPGKGVATTSLRWDNRLSSAECARHFMMRASRERWMSLDSPGRSRPMQRTVWRGTASRCPAYEFPSVLPKRDTERIPFP